MTVEQEQDSLIQNKECEFETDSKGPGCMLRKAREDAGLTIEEVAKYLYLSPRMIDALECDEYNEAIGLTFIRGYLKTYARFLDLSVEEVMDAFNALNLQEQPVQLPMQAIYKKRNTFLGKLPVWVISFLIAGFGLFVLIWWRSQHTQPAVATMLSTDAATHDTQIAKPATPGTTPPVNGSASTVPAMIPLPSQLFTENPADLKSPIGNMPASQPPPVQPGHLPGSQEPQSMMAPSTITMLPQPQASIVPGALPTATPQMPTVATDNHLSSNQEARSKTQAKPKAVEIKPPFAE